MSTPLPTLTDGQARHLLVVDDDDRIRNLLKEYLARAGFRVTGAPDAAAARKLVASLDFDLMVLDVMMPGEDGFSLARWIRGRQSTPVLMLTARDAATDRIEGLSLGADDYLAKPFDPRELVLRIEAILRRVQAAPRAVVLALGACAFDAGRGELTRDGEPVRLTEAEAKLRSGLMEAARALATAVEERVQYCASLQTAAGALQAGAAGLAHAVERFCPGLPGGPCRHRRPRRPRGALGPGAPRSPGGP